MWQVSESIRVKATPSIIWNIWNKPAEWPLWDTDVESCVLVGEFKQGSKGTLKPKGGPAVHFEITELTHEKSFTDIARLPFTKLIFEHDMKMIEPNDVLITHTIKIQGLLTFLFSKVIGKNIAKNLPHALKNLAMKAERVNLGNT